MNLLKCFEEESKYLKKLLQCFFNYSMFMDDGFKFFLSIFFDLLISLIQIFTDNNFDYYFNVVYSG